MSIPIERLKPGYSIPFLPLSPNFPLIFGTIQRDWERMVTFYQFPKEHWKHLRTTNPVESPFAALRLRTDAAKRYKKVENATAVIWKMLMLAEQRFRRLDAPERMKQVYLGVQFRDGIEVKNVLRGVEGQERVMAA